MIGCVSGTLVINQLTSIQSYLSGIFHQTGSVIGYVQGMSSNFLNILIQMELDNNQGYYTGALTGFLYSELQTVHNIKIQQTVITGKVQAGLIACQLKKIYLSQLIIMSSQVNTFSSTDPQSFSFSGSITGQTSDEVSIFQCYIQNITITSQSFTSKWAISGGLIGDTHEFATSIKSVKIISADIQAFGSATNTISSGGLIAFLYDSNISISDIQVMDSNLTAFNNNSVIQCAGFLASLNNNNNISIQNSSITTVRVSGAGSNSYLGIVLSISANYSFSFSNVSITGTNSINGAVIANCPNVIAPSINGC
ncbi:Hypothetical_protein [Hexamita inflata]|uniref:Hypothetical_protein n=1 Tax=Hexamita inflata TaxID=28002 RepID=A0AA86PNH7_9EUKA|nr:Hypothetical protein HINF_LOCUS25704 [Hexamita inflata]